MPIHKRDRNFQRIVSELEIKTVPTEYVQTLALVCENGDRISFDGEDLDDYSEGDVVATLIQLVETNNDLVSPVIDVEIVIDYTKLEKDVNQKTKELLKNDNR